MRVFLVLFVVTLVLLSSLTFAVEDPVATSSSPQLPTTTPQSVLDARISDANRFLSAEVTRSVRTEMTSVKEDLKAYNDENFRAFDGRLATFTVNAKQQIIIGGIGAILVANALIGLALIWMFRRYSYEYYQQTVIESKEKELDDVKRDLKGFQQMQETSWNMQQTPQTIGKVYGQEVAANISAMNQWQTQPVYGGAWQAPQESVQPYQPPQQQPQYTTQNEEQDPMARPWTMNQQGGM